MKKSTTTTRNIVATVMSLAIAVAVGHFLSQVARPGRFDYIVSHGRAYSIPNLYGIVAGVIYFLATTVIIARRGDQYGFAQKGVLSHLGGIALEVVAFVLLSLFFYDLLVEFSTAANVKSDWRYLSTMYGRLADFAAMVTVAVMNIAIFVIPSGERQK